MGTGYEAGYTLGSTIGILLWSLIPGFIARHKGRSFLGWYFLSFLISPLISTIIVCCLKDISTYAAPSEAEAKMIYTSTFTEQCASYLPNDAINRPIAIKEFAVSSDTLNSVADLSANADLRNLAVCEILTWIKDRIINQKETDSNEYIDYLSRAYLEINSNALAQDLISKEQYDENRAQYMEFSNKS